MQDGDAGEWGGTALLDDCGICNGANASQDCLGVCNVIMKINDGSGTLWTNTPGVGG